jgi:hypothetical protein
VGTPITRSALDAGLARLVAAGTITGAQADAVRAELGAPERVTGVAPAVEGTAGAAPVDRRPLTAVLAEVAGYVGAAFVGAAVIAVAGPRWDSLGTGGQLAVLLVPAALMLAAAVGVASSAPGSWTPRAVAPGQGPRRRLVSVLVLLAAGLCAGAAGVIARGDGEQPVAAAVVGLVLAGAGYVLCRTVLLHLGVAFAATMTVYAVTDLAGADFDVAGALVVVLGVVWALAALAGVLAERVLGLVVAAGLAFVGAENVVIEASGAAELAGYAALLAVAVAGLGGYLALREVPVLAAGALVLAVAVPQVVVDYSDGALGAAGALLVSGLTIVAASVFGLRTSGRAAARPVAGP